jgi:hypothetical protein
MVDDGVDVDQSKSDAAMIYELKDSRNLTPEADECLEKERNRSKLWNYAMYK